MAFKDVVLPGLLHTLSKCGGIYFIQGQPQADSAVLVGSEAVPLSFMVDKLCCPPEVCVCCRCTFVMQCCTY